MNRTRAPRRSSGSVAATKALLWTAPSKQAYLGGSALRIMAVVTRDVVIVGGGIAGLSAAWRLRHRDVLLLEAGDRGGGRMRSDACGEYWLNYGAHLFPAPGSLIDGMARECGLETVPVTGSMMGLAVGATLLNHGRVETYPL